MKKRSVGRERKEGNEKEKPRKRRTREEQEEQYTGMLRHQQPYASKRV